MRTPRSLSLEIGSYISFAVAVVFVGARVYTRHCIVRSLGWDDAFVVTGLFMSLGITLSIAVMFSNGMGLHASELTKHQFELTRRWGWISQIFYYATLSATKCGILSLYLRLTCNPRHRLLLHVLCTAMFIHGLLGTVLTIRLCKSISTIWSPKFPEGCIDVFTFNYIGAVFHILTDLILALLPALVIMRMHGLRRREKMWLCLVFAVGLSAIGATVQRQVANTLGLYEADFPWSWAPVAWWTALEVNLALVCASLPMLRPLGLRLFPSWASTTDGSAEGGEVPAGVALAGGVGVGGLGGAVPLGRVSKTLATTGTTVSAMERGLGGRLWTGRGLGRSVAGESEERIVTASDEDDGPRNHAQEDEAGVRPRIRDEDEGRSKESLPARPPMVRDGARVGDFDRRGGMGREPERRRRSEDDDGCQGFVPLMPPPPRLSLGGRGA
ncbi:hypothetical protein EDC01DRAFT_640172 [Geopyxis carbonaria]|nr:hypothetical protein EDC01DRAFT_640172 [Geopyxis carbonaria]